MLDLKFIRENSEKVKRGCQKKQVKVDIDQLLETDKKHRRLLQEVEKLRAEQNKLSVKEKIKEEERQQAKEIKDKIKSLEPELEKTEKELEEVMKQVPNLPLADVPEGKDEKDNQVLKEVGKKPKFDFKPRDYLEITEKLDLIDIERAAKVSGTRFNYLKGQAVLLEFALVQLALDVLTKDYNPPTASSRSPKDERAPNFVPIVPPVMLKAKAMAGMGYLDRGADEVYHLERDDLYLVGTAEQSIGVMHMDEILKEKELPKRYVGFSTCFRREAGAYGKDTRGILRVHQFDKVEMFSFCHPDKSKEEHQLLLAMEEKLIRLLKIPYRVVQMCTGDLGDPAAAKFDIEAWLPGEGKYRETHSTSNCTDFQARRLNIRFRQEKDKQELRFVHTLNGTAYAIGRTLIAIIENHQQKDGSIKVPEVLRKYLGGMKKIG